MPEPTYVTGLLQEDEQDWSSEVLRPRVDHDTAHGLVITASGDQFSWMPMTSDRPAFTGSALWFLGIPLRPECTLGRSPSRPPHTALTTTCARSLGTHREA